MDTPGSSGYATVNGLNMYYELHGSEGTPLVLIHGGGSTIESSFGVLLPLLSVHRKVIAVELQAHGRTGDRDAPESFEQDADDVAALLQTLRVNRADILGFSNGGTTALQIALRHPAIVNRMVVISACYQREGLVPGLLDGLRQATLEDMPRLLKTAFLRVAPDKNRLQVMFEKDRERMLTFKDMSDADLRSLRPATLIVAADRDVVTPEHSVKMSRLIPDSRLAILPGTHGSCIGEVGSGAEGGSSPELTAALIDEFLGQ